MPYTRTSKSLGFHKDGRKIYTKIPCPLCNGEQGHVQNVVENYEGHDQYGSAIDQFRIVPVRKCRNCGAFHDKHGKLIEDGL